MENVGRVVIARAKVSEVRTVFFVRVSATGLLVWKANKNKAPPQYTEALLV